MHCSSIRVHSCPFVSIRGSIRLLAFPFATSRLRVTQTSLQTPLPHSPGSTQLGLNPRLHHSCPFVVQILHLRLSVKIRVNPWPKRTSVALHSLRGFARHRLSANCPHPRTPVRGSPTELRTPNFCVSLRDFAASRETNTPAKLPCRPAAAGQISGWKARAKFIRVHSCPFVVQILLHSWFKSRTHDYPWRRTLPPGFFLPPGSTLWPPTPLHAKLPDVKSPSESASQRSHRPEPP